MEYVQMTLDDWLTAKERLKQELIKAQQSFVRIGYMLRKIDDQKLYEQDGYKSIAEFARSEYGLDAPTVSKFININKRYSMCYLLIYMENMCNQIPLGSTVYFQPVLKFVI